MLVELLKRIAAKHNTFKPSSGDLRDQNNFVFRKAERYGATKGLKEGETRIKLL